LNQCFSRGIDRRVVFDKNASTLDDGGQGRVKVTLTIPPGAAMVESCSCFRPDENMSSKSCTDR